jgi:hypothetical protein
MGSRSMHPGAERRFGQIEVAGHGADTLAFVEHEPDRLRLEVVIKPPTLASSLGGLGMVVGILSAFRNVSTKPDQAHQGSLGS